MTIGEYKSIEHRAFVNHKKEFLSFPAFHNLNTRSMICPMRELLKEKTTNYKTITDEEYVRPVISCTLDGKGLLTHTRTA